MKSQLHVGQARPPRVALRRRSLLSSGLVFVCLALLVLTQLGLLRAQTAWNVNANGNWNTSGNWTPAAVPNAVGANVTLGSVITANRIVTVNTNVTLGTLTINDNNNYTLSRTSGGGTNLLTFDASGSGPATINIQNSGSPTISTSGNRLRVSLADNTVINHTGTGTFTISTIIQGAGSLTHNGTGTSLLSGANTFSGGLTVDGGTVQFGNNAAAGTGTLTLNGGTILASSASRTLSNAVTVGGDFEVGGTQALILSGAMNLGASQREITTTNTALSTFSGVVSGSGGLTKAGSGVLVLQGGNTFTGDTLVNAGTLRASSAGTAFGSNSTTTLANTAGVVLDLNSFNTAIGSLAGGGTTGGNVTLGSATLTTGGDNGSTSFGGIISGSGGITKAGTGTWTLTGANTYTGATAINAGAINIQNATALGTTAGATTVASGAQLQVQGGITSAEALTLNGTGVSGTGAIRNISGNNVLSGAVTRAGATTITSDAGLLTLSGAVSGNFDLTVGGAGNTTISGIVSGTAGLTKNDAGTLVLSGTNTYDGVTTLNAGILSVSNMANGGTASNIGDSSNAAGNLVFNGGTLQYTGSGSTTNRLFTLGTGGGTIVATGSGALNFSQTGNLTYSGSGARTLTLSGTSTATNNLSANIGDGTGGATSLIKDGTGTWRISGDNTFTGNATVKDGLLEMNSNTINGGVPPTAGLIVGDGVGAADSAIARNLQEGQVGNTSTVTVYSDGWFDLNSAAYPNKGGDAFWKEETVGQINLYGGHITTGSTGSLNMDASLPGATIASFSNSQTALIDATGGQVALNANRTISVGNGSQTTDLEIRGTIANSVTGTGSSSVTKTGDGRLTFTGTAANSYTGETVVNGGTLELAKSSGVTSIASTSVTVNSGGTLLLGNNNQINDAANLTLNSGILSTGEGVGYSETLGTLTMSGSSSINLGTAAHMLNFANSSALSGSWSGTLTIYGWTGLPATSGTSGQIYFGNNVSGLTSGQLSMISFDGFGPGAMLLTNGELVPVAVPEAEVVLAALLLLGAVAWRERKALTASVSLVMSSIRQGAVR